MTSRNHVAKAATVGAVALLFGFSTIPAQGQTSGGGWTAFVGCWEPLDAGDDAGLLCFRPLEGGVEMFNVVDREVVSREQLSADETPRPVSAEGCTGFEGAAFSGDSLRVFTRSELTCSGEIRAGSGIMSFLEPDLWIDVRSLQVQGEPVAWIQRYELAGARAIADQGIDDPADFDPVLVRVRRDQAALAIEVDDVEEAALRVDARAVEVWLAANETRLDLSGSELVRLAEAGVPESVIDVMVAVSYPERFTVSSDGTAEAALWPDAPYGRGPYPWGPHYVTLGFGFYGYPPFGYYGWGCCGYYGYRPVTVVVAPAGKPAPRGRMVPGRGYTRGSASSGSRSGSAPSSSGPPTTPSARSGGTSGGGSASSGSSGSSRSSGGRTAQRRGN